ncbi:MAG: phosphatase PAP2 family protein [Elusimicrobia bacterium]|nr:phosphatase PAP2 family protein [Elusimicrobiota bacterium]
MIRRWKTTEFLLSLAFASLALAAFQKMARSFGWRAFLESPGGSSLLLLAVCFPAIAHYLAKSDPALPRLRLWIAAPFIAMGYGVFKMIMQEFARRTHEGLLYHADLAFGWDVYDWAGRGLAPWLSEIFGAAYLFYFLYCLGRAFTLTLRQGADEKMERFALGLTTTYILGFIGYVLLPALGPRYAIGHTFPPTGPLFSPLAVALVDWAGSPWAVMPSMHVGATAFVLFSDAFHDRRWFALGLIPVLTVWASTMGLGFHYCCDVLAGLACAAMGLAAGHFLPVWLPETRRTGARVRLFLRRLGAHGDVP